MLSGNKPHFTPDYKKFIAMLENTLLYLHTDMPCRNWDMEDKKYKNQKHNFKQDLRE
jgi:hypothetical protein